MVLTGKALSLITTRTKNRLALELNCSVASVERWIRLNEPNGDLTKTQALKIISEETELVVEDLLEQETEKEQQDTAARA